MLPDSLLQAALNDKKATFDVLIQSDGSDSGDKLAARVAKMLGKGSTKAALGGALRAQFATAASVEVMLSGKDVLNLAHQKGLLSLVPNACATPSGLGNTQKWPDAVGLRQFWASAQASVPAPTIAIVDSGVDNSSGQFGNRLLAQVDLGGGFTTGDGRGHGTFVTSLAAGSGTYGGAAPNATLVSLDVFDARGCGKSSDILRAADWILQHKAEYNIRVANFSLTTGGVTSFMFDPLDLAVERLWQAGVVVVTAAGNYARDGQASSVLFAPANDPFAITVGAADIHGSAQTQDDTNAPWSAYGYTPDGFAKPELAAPGRYMIEQVPLTATLLADFSNNVLSPGVLQLSGTSFSAPVVSGMAADLLGAHPTWTPDQVKGALMVSATALPGAAPNSMGVGEVNLQKAIATADPPNPNAALNKFLVPDAAGGPFPVFDAASWAGAARGDASWRTASWSAASWSAASWNAASWAAASWNAASWAAASWANASWCDASWSDASWSASAATNNAASDGVGDG